MSGLRITLAALLAGAAMLASLPASAQPREALQLENTVTPNTPLDEWLRRLVGKYRFEGVIEVVYYPAEDGHRCGALPTDPNEAGSDEPTAPVVPYCSSIKGVGDCVGIGTGPGVQCVLDLKWQEMYEDLGAYSLPGGASYLDPAMALYGIDPGKAGINFLLVDNKGLPEGAMGSVTANAAIFRTPCVNAPILFNAMKVQTVDDRPLQTCDKIIRVEAKPDAKLLFMTIEIEINDTAFTTLTLSMRRT